MGVLGGVLEFLQTAVIVIVLTFLIRTFVVQPFYIIGSSMEPTLYEGQLLMIDQLSYRLGDPQRGDVVVIHPPHDTVDYIKRIIGTPGDTVVITADGDVMINGQALDEPYLGEANQDTKGQLSISLSEDEYFVLGDNREVSNDSRGGINQLTNRAENPWTIQKEDMVGKALLRWWPLNQFGLIHHPDYEL